MNTAPTHHVDHTGTEYPRTKLFLLSIVALTAAGMVFSIRAATLVDMQKVFFDPYHATEAGKLITGAAGVAFLAFAFSIFIGSPLCDILGMNRLLGLASVLHIAGTMGTLLAPAGPNVYPLLAACMFTVGIAHGLVEAVINPLVATIYPNDKTHRLNVLHAWWPGGIIIGGLIGATPFDWKTKLAAVLVPAIIYGLMIIGTKFPPTERKAAGISNTEMVKELLRPGFILLFCCMFLTAASELAPGQWVDAALSRAVGFKGILLLVYVSALMFVMRHFAGNLAHKLSPIGMMWLSCALAAVGLVTLSQAHSMVTALMAATVWGTGVCYMWPTMLAIVSERFPRGGAFALGVIGSAGSLSIYFVLPQIGKIFDDAKLAGASAAGKTFEALQQAGGPELDKVLSEAYAISFRSVAILPAILVFVFGAWWFWDKARGGYKAVKLEQAQEG